VALPAPWPWLKPAKSVRSDGGHSCRWDAGRSAYGLDQVSDAPQGSRIGARRGSDLARSRWDVDARAHPCWRWCRAPVCTRVAAPVGCLVKGRSCLDGLSCVSLGVILWAPRPVWSSSASSRCDYRCLLVVNDQLQRPNTILARPIRGATSRCSRSCLARVMGTGPVCRRTRGALLRVTRPSSAVWRARDRARTAVRPAFVWVTELRRRARRAHGRRTGDLQQCRRDAAGSRKPCSRNRIDQTATASIHDQRTRTRHRTCGRPADRDARLRVARALAWVRCVSRSRDVTR